LQGVPCKVSPDSDEVPFRKGGGNVTP